MACWCRTAQGANSERFSSAAFPPVVEINIALTLEGHHSALQMSCTLLSEDAEHPGWCCPVMPCAACVNILPTFWLSPGNTLHYALLWKRYCWLLILDRAALHHIRPLAAAWIPGAACLLQLLCCLSVEKQSDPCVVCLADPLCRGVE